MKKLWLLAAFLMLTPAAPVVVTQQQEPSLKPSISAKAADAPTRLLLEVRYNPSIPPAYATVNGPEVKAKWLWVTRFVRVPGVQNGTPIQAVRLESQFNGETADVRVTLLRGEKGFDKEDLVGVYQVGVGEQRTINDLRNYGVEPFSITLLNTVPPLPPPAAFENLTKSIEIASVRSENVPHPAYVVTFRNASEKQLLAIRVDVKKDGRPGLSSLFHAADGRPISEPGGTAEHYLPVTTAQQTAAGYAPSTASANTIVIRAAVFSDMSFEGDVQIACQFESMVMGRRVWLKQVLALLDQELPRPINDHIEAARQFKERFSALEYKFSEAERNQASKVSPACAPPIGLAEIPTKALTLELLRDLDQIITKRPLPPLNFKTWLETRHEYYKGWLARL